MKVLVIYCTAFSYLPNVKTIEDAEDITLGKAFNDCIVAFIQVEAEDEAQEIAGREKKLVNHLKWTARKNLIFRCSCATCFGDVVPQKKG